MLADPRDQPVLAASDIENGAALELIGAGEGHRLWLAGTKERIPVTRSAAANEFSALVNS